MRRLNGLIKMIKYILILVLLISGCAAVSDAVVPPKEKIVHIDPRALEPCEDLVGLDSNSSEIETTIRNFEIYADCKRKQNNSIILLKQFSNIQEKQL